MLLTQEQILHIAQLAQLKLPEESIPTYQKELNDIVKYIETLDRIPQSELDALGEPALDALTLNADEITSVATRDEMLSCTTKPIINHQIAISNIMH